MDHQGSPKEIPDQSRSITDYFKKKTKIMCTFQCKTHNPDLQIPKLIYRMETNHQWEEKNKCVSEKKSATVGMQGINVGYGEVFVKFTEEWLKMGIAENCMIRRENWKFC